MTEPPPLMPASPAQASMRPLSSEAENVRAGSPFAAGSASPGPALAGPALAGPALAGWSPLLRAEPEPMGEGVYRETATAAACAAWMLLAFAIAGYGWFPAGGMAIALLGSAMGLMGLTSRYVKRSAVALTGHGIILMGCYFKLL